MKTAIKLVLIYFLMQLIGALFAGPFCLLYTYFAYGTFDMDKAGQIAVAPTMLLGFVFMTLAAGFMVERFPDHAVLHGIGMAAGTAVCYLFGTVWLAEQMSLTFTEALGIGVIPYLPGDAAKILLAVILGPKLRRIVRPILSR